MKIQTISVILISLVSGLTFISQATAAHLRQCAENETRAGGRCIPKMSVPPLVTSTVDINKCSAFQDTVTCELPTNHVTMPKKAFENLVRER